VNAPIQAPARHPLRSGVLRSSSAYRLDALAEGVLGYLRSEKDHALPAGAWITGRFPSEPPHRRCLGRELQFVGQRGELGAFRLNVEINVATVPGIVSPGSEKANDRVLTETLLRQGYDLRTFRIRQPHALTHLVDDRNVGS
jgi:hypothetical protein